MDSFLLARCQSLHQPLPVMKWRSSLCPRHTLHSVGGGHGDRGQAEVAGDGRGQLVSEALDARTRCQRVPEQSEAGGQGVRDWRRCTGTPGEVGGTEGIPAGSGAGNTCPDFTSGQAYLRLGQAVRTLGFHSAWEMAGRGRQEAAWEMSYCRDPPAGGNMQGTK